MPSIGMIPEFEKWTGSNWFLKEKVFSRTVAYYYVTCNDLVLEKFMIEKFVNFCSASKMVQ